MYIVKKVLIPNRIRKINGSFSFIPHAFFLDGFWVSLTQEELLLYLFLVMVGDRQGLSFYSQDKICSLLKMGFSELQEARKGLITKDLIAFDGLIFQVLSLPEKVTRKTSSTFKYEDRSVSDEISSISDILKQHFTEEE